MGGDLRRMIGMAAVAACAAMSADAGLSQTPEGLPADCVERFDATRTRPGLVEVRISSSCRKEGDAASFSLGGYAVQAPFDAWGRAHAALPLLERLNVLNWRDAEDRPRAELIEFPDFDSTIQIVLIWEGEADLDLLPLESPSSFSDADAGEDEARGGVAEPEGSGLRRDEGYGRLALSSLGGRSGFHAEVYLLEAPRNPVLQGRLLRGRVEPRVEVSLADETRRAACEALLAGPARVHFTIRANLYGRVRLSRQAFDKAACDPATPSERRLMRLEPIDFTAK